MGRVSSSSPSVTLLKTVPAHFTITMKFFVLLLCVGLSTAAMVRREAEPDAEPQAEADAEAFGFGYASSAPVCTHTPVKECTPRQVKKPRKVCQTVFDLYEDTVVTENCEEVVTTECTQISQTSTQTSKVVDKSTSLVEAGVPKPIPHAHHVKRHAHAEAEPEPQADAEAEAEPWYGHRYNHHTYAAYVAPLVAHSPVVSSPAKTVNPPVCNSTPVKTCHRVPVSTPRKVSRTVCDTVVDVTTIQDCHETVTKTCQQSHTKTSSSSAVVGRHTKVIPEAHVANYLG